MNEFVPDYHINPDSILGLRAIDFLSEEENVCFPTVFPKIRLCICCDMIGGHHKDCLHIACLKYINGQILNG